MATKILLNTALALMLSQAALADDGSKNLSSCLRSILSLPRTRELDRARVLGLFEKKTLHESPERFLTLTNREGRLFNSKVVGYVEHEGKSLAKVMLEDGYAIAVDLEKVKSLAISDESRALWEKKQQDFLRNLNQRTLHTGDAQYLTLDSPDSEGAFMVRVTGYEKVNDQVLPLVMHTEGYVRVLDPSEFENAFSSIEAKKRWLGMQTDEGLVMVKKSVTELPLKRKDLIERAGLQDLTNSSPIDGAQKVLLDGSFIEKTESGEQIPENFEAFLLGTPTGNDRISKMARSIDEKMNVKALYSEEANTAQNSLGFSLKHATLLDEKGNALYPNQEIINLSKHAQSGRIGSTEIHEIGHARTNRNLKEGKPDPLAIQYKALPGKPLPAGKSYGLDGSNDLYRQFSSADESRQHAYNFHHAVHQRVTSEVIADFSKRPELEAWKAFGVNLQNFHTSMRSAKQILESLEVFNLRHTELALYAQRKLALGFNQAGMVGQGFEFTIPKSGKYAEVIITTQRSKVTVPVIGNAYETLIEPLIRDDGKGIYLQFSKNSETIPKLRSYLNQYLWNQINMLDEQYIAIKKSKELLAPLSQYPFLPISLDDYLKIQNTFTQVKTSVNYSPKKVQNLLWVDPAFKSP